MRILLVEDDSPIAAFLRRGLSEEGHVVRVAEDLAAARRALGESSWDALVCDRMLPDGDGLDLIRECRRAGNLVPALCLTARDRVPDRVEGLQGGADDYLVKPFAFEELLARLAALVRRVNPGERRLRCGDLEIEVEAVRVMRAGREIRLTAQEFALLRYLLEHRGQVLSRPRLLEAVWDIHFDPGTNVVDVYIGYLRAKVDKGFATPLLHTVRGVGYVLEDRPR